MEAPKVQRFLNPEMERQPSEVARLRVLKGIDRGTVFILNESSVVLGRGDDAQVRVADLKASRIHARLDYTKEGWLVTDLGSANGIFFQGEYVRKTSIRSGDHFTLGETIFEFLIASENTRMLMAPLKNAQEVEEMDRALTHQKQKVRSLGVVASSEQAKKPEKSKKNLILIVGLLAAYLVLFPEEDQKAAKTKKVAEKKEEEQKPYSNEPVDRESKKTAEQYYRQGFREYREKNYLRARAQFELALQVDPNHALARRYLYVSDQESKNEVKKLIMSAQKAKAIGKLKSAKGYFEAAMRLMYNDQSNPDFIECEAEVKKIVEELERTRQL